MKNKLFVLITFYLFVILLGCYLIYTKTEVKQSPIVSKNISSSKNSQEKNDGFGVSYTIYSKRIKEKILTWKNDIYSLYESSKIDFSYEIYLNNKLELVLKINNDELDSNDYKIADDVIAFQVISETNVEKVYFINDNGTVGSLDLLNVFLSNDFNLKVINPIVNLQEIVSIVPIENTSEFSNYVAFIDIRGNMYANINEEGVDF